MAWIESNEYIAERWNVSFIEWRQDNKSQQIRWTAGIGEQEWVSEWVSLVSVVAEAGEVNSAWLKQNLGK